MDDDKILDAYLAQSPASGEGSADVHVTPRVPRWFAVSLIVGIPLVILGLALLVSVVRL